MVKYYINYVNQKPSEFLYLTLASWIAHNKNNTLTLVTDSADQAVFQNFIKPFVNNIYITDKCPSDDYVLFPSFAIVLSDFCQNGFEEEPSFYCPSEAFLIKPSHLSSQQLDIPTDVLVIPLNILDYFPLLWQNDSILGYYWNFYVSPFLCLNGGGGGGGGGVGGGGGGGVDSFSFCLYGSNPKYCEGIFQNIQLAQELFPEFHIFLYIRNDVPEEYIKKYITSAGDNLHIYYISSFKVMTLYRLLTINHYMVKSVFCRDADSRLCSRDKECIMEFLRDEAHTNPKQNFQVIRDHFFHKSKIMAGTFGWKYIPDSPRPNMFFLFQKWMELNSASSFESLKEYGTDEQFLEYFYTKFPDNLFIQTNIVAFRNEITHKMPPISPTQSSHDFIGNTWEIQGDLSIPTFSYHNFPLETHIQWLINHNQWEILQRMEADGFYDWQFLQKFQGSKNGLFGLKNIIEYFFQAQIKSEHPESCSKARTLLGLFHNTVCMDENTYKNSNKLFAKSAIMEGTRFIATTNPNRMPKDSSECILIYGDYPYYAKNLWTNCIQNRIFRNVMFYNEDLGVPIHWEYESCWEPINTIYVLNLEEARDRWIAVLGELAKMGAPLNRIHHYKAKRAEPRGDKLQVYAGATKNHCDCVKNFIESGGEYCLILEDDFMFCSDYENNKLTLDKFFKRKYDFDLCMISYSKIGTTEEKDDMIFLSHQACTTSSGYILKKSTAEKIYSVLFEGYTLMLATGDYGTFCCDRYWAKIQKDNGFFLLKDKLGYQRIIYSNITGLQNMYLD
jgi:hypothetical protein